jgi:hypothetical protein
MTKKMNKLLIAKHSQSLENPYHFWTGYFLPIMNELKKDDSKKNTYFVRECGPMTHWLEYLKLFYDIRIIKPGMLLNELVSGKESVIFDHWDDPDNFKNKDFLESILFTKLFFTKDSKIYNKKIGLLNRKESLNFYSSGQQEISAYSSIKRKIKNIDDLFDKIKDKYLCEMVDTTKLSPGLAVKKYKEFNILIGQKGAGLTNMIWMDKGSTVIEICTPKILISEKWDKCYEMLAESIGFNYIKIYAQETWDGNVDINLILNSIQKEKNK